MSIVGFQKENVALKKDHIKV